MSFFFLETPLASFRPYEARDYQETYPVPPPATVFGCLLSVVGVERAEAAPYIGTCMALAAESGPVSTLLRKMRRDPANPKRARPKVPEFRPEYQEVLSDVRLWILLERGKADRDLGAELAAALREPSGIQRYGLVSLGESSFLVDTLHAVSEPPEIARVLVPRAEGSVALPVWVDYGDRARTRTVRFDLTQGHLGPEHAVALEPSEG